MAEKHNHKKQLLFMATSALVFTAVIVCLVVTKITNLQNQPPTEPAKSNNQLNSSDLYLYQFKSKHFSADLGSKDLPNQPLVNFASKDSAIEFFPTGIDYSSVKQEKRDDKSIAYLNVWPGISLNYTFTEKAIKEDIYVASYKDLKIYKANRGDLSFEFKVKPKNVLLRKKTIDNIEYYYFLDATTGEYRFRFEPPFMVDNNGNRSTKVDLSVKESASLEENSVLSEYTFLITPDEKWLEKAVYPVRIDPTASIIDLYDTASKIDDANSSGYIVDGGQAKINLVDWYSESGTYWNYRTPITFNGTGVTGMINHDLLVGINTSALVASGKLQSDCDDLRFTDNGGTTELSFWVESGCNTASTKIWVRLASIAGGENTTFYVYYGNSGASASANLQSWGGGIIVPFNSALPSGWSSNANFNGVTDATRRFPIGSSSYGTTDGVATHTHSVSSNNPGAHFDATKYYTAGTYTLQYCGAHQHTFPAGTTNAATLLPRYYDLIFAEKANIPPSYEANSVFLFTVNTANLPSGWADFTGLNTNNRFPRGNGSGAGTSSDTNTHNHTYTTTSQAGTCVNSSYSVATTGGSTSWAAYSATSHTHTFTATLATSLNQTPQYLQVVYGYNSSASTLPGSSIVMFRNLPPRGWTRYTSLDNLFPQGNEASGGTGGSASHSHENFQGASQAQFGYTSSTVTQASGTAMTFTYWHNGGGHDHHPNMAVSTTYEHQPPSVTTIFGTRNTSNITTSNGSETNAPKSATIQSINLLSGISLVTSLTSLSYSISTIPTGSSASIQFSPDATTWYNGSCSSGARESMSVGTNTINFSGVCWSTSAFYYKLALSGTGGNTPLVDDVSLNYVYVGAPLWCTLEKGPGNNQIIINWNDPNSSETSYQIDKSTNGSWSATPYYDTTVANIVTYTDSTSISAGNTYAYRVRAKLTASYTDWCYTVALTLGSGGFRFEGLKIEGLKID